MGRNAYNQFLLVKILKRQPKTQCVQSIANLMNCGTSALNYFMKCFVTQTFNFEPKYLKIDLTSIDRQINIQFEVHCLVSMRRD